MSEDKKKNIEILVKAVILGQSRGAYTLKDASLMNEVIRCLADEKDTKYPEIECISALVQGASLAQKAGAFTLDDASLVFDSIKWFESQNNKKLETIEEVDEDPKGKQIA
jgi:hypothetical protein